MIEESPFRLMASLEARIERLLEERDRSLDERRALQARLDDLALRCRALEARHAELLAEAAARQRDGEAKRAELEGRLAEAEGARRQLAQENRELDARNRELEARHESSQAASEKDAPSPAFSRSSRPSRGLSALIGHHRPAPPEPAPAEARDLAPAAPDSAQAALPIDEAPSPQSLLAQWYQRYPETFFKGHTRPLKVGIHEDLTAREPWPEKLVRRALACYVNLPRYLKSVREGAERLDLEGAPAGVVDPGAAEHARKKLERLQAERRRKGKASGRRESRRPDKAARSSGAVSRPAPTPPSPAASEPAPPPAPAPAVEEPDDQRLQRKLDALVARHRSR